MAPIIIDTGIFDRPILIQTDNQSRIVREIVIEEQNPIIIDTGIFDRPILVQPKQFELSENSKQVSQRSYVVQEGDSEVLVEEVVYEEFIDEDDGADGERVVVEEIVEEYIDENGNVIRKVSQGESSNDESVVVEEVVEEQPVEIVEEKQTEAPVQETENVVEEVVEEVVSEPKYIVVEEQEKPIIIDTGVFDRPILIQSGVEQQPKEVVVSQDEPAECRGDTGCWWLFHKPQATEVVEEEEKPIIIDTGIFDRPILVQSGVEQQPREVVVEEEEKPIIIDTGIFDRPILVQSGVEQQPREVVVEEEKPIIIDTGIFDRPILVQSGVEQQPREVVVAQDEPAECRGDTGCWWLFYKPQATEVIEEQPREVVVEEEEKPIIIDTGIFDRPILVQSGVEQQPREVVIEEEEKPIIIDTGIFDRPILVQSGVEQQPREIVVAQDEPAECRGDTGCWWLFTKPETTVEVVEVPEVAERSVEVPEVVAVVPEEKDDSVLKVHCKLPLGYEGKQWVPYANRSVECLTSLPLGIDFHTPERQWVPYANRSVEVLCALPLGYHPVEEVKEVPAPAPAPVEEAKERAAAPVEAVPVAAENISNVKEVPADNADIIEQLKREIMIRDQLLKKKDDELDELKNIVDKKDNELKSQNTEYQNLIRSNEELNHQLTQLNIMNKKLQQNVKSSGLVTPPNEGEREIEANNALLSCRLENAAIHNEIKLKNAEIEKLTSRIVALNQQLARLTLSVDEEQRKDRETISILRSKVDGYLEKLVKLNGQVSALTLLIDELKSNKEATAENSAPASTSNGNNAVAKKYIYLSPESRQIITNIVSRATQNKCNILWILALLFIFFIFFLFKFVFKV